MRSPLTVIGCVFVLLLSGGCGGVESSTPRSAAQAYEQAIVSKDGDRLCATFAPKLREVLAEQLRDEPVTAGATGRPRFDCGAFYHVVLNGYPHENTDRRFVAAKLLDVGSPRRLKRRGVVYMKVPARLRIQFVYTGYSIHGGTRGEKGAAIVEDVVWLAKGTSGKWGVVKPSLALLAAGTPDVLYEPWRVARANAAPPDPDYSMNRAERTAWEASDYRASFRQKIGHAPLRCGGQSTLVADPLHDAVTYPTGSALHPVGAPHANDIARVTVDVAGRRMCVTLTFRKKPSGRLRIGFTARSRRAVFGYYVVEIDPVRRVRGGNLTAGYRYFRGGDQLRRSAVGTITLYAHSVAFVANARTAPTDLMWAVIAATPGGTDHVPNATPGSYVLIRQRDGSPFTP
jgi:hypothetical protein